MTETIKKYIDAIGYEVEGFEFYKFNKKRIIVGRTKCNGDYLVFSKTDIREDLIVIPLTDFLIESIDKVVGKIWENKEVFDTLEDGTKLYKNGEFYFEDEYYLTKGLVERLGRALYGIDGYSIQQFMEDIILLIKK